MQFLLENIDDITYYTSLLVCVTVGSCYKRIEDLELKRHCGAGLGIIVACLICGQYIHHSIWLVSGNIVLIKSCDRRFVHQVSMAFTWMYLMFLHININSMYVIWINQTIALRLVGIAFEMSSTRKPIPVAVSDKTGSYKKEIWPSTSKVIAPGQGPLGRSTPKPSLVPNRKTTAIDLLNNEPSIVDIIAYTYFFVGLHKGPFFKWNIYRDHFLVPFDELSDCRMITEQKLKRALVCAAANVFLQIIFSPRRYFEDDFYNEYGTDYRFLYNVPQLVMYVLQYQILMMLCTSVFTETGFGVYPAKCVPLPEHALSVQQSLMQMIFDDRDAALEENNFAMLKCFENVKLIFGPRMKDTLRGWDMPTRYWFWSNIYKNLINSNREVRSASSFLAWSMWCGPSLQQMIVASTLWVHINLEEEYALVYETQGSMKIPWDIGFTIMRLFCLIYLTPCFVINDYHTIVKYYSSIYWVFHLFLFILIIGAIVAYKSKEQ